MEIAVFIQNIQEERAEVALYIFSNQSSKDATRKKALTERFQMTDHALEEMPTWPHVRCKYGLRCTYFTDAITFSIIYYVAFPAL